MFDNKTHYFFAFFFHSAFLLIFWSKMFLYAYQWVTLKEEFQVKIELIVNFDIATKQKHINLSSLQRYLYEFVFILPKWVRIRVYFNKMSTTPCLFFVKFVSIDSKSLTCSIAHRRGSIYWIFHSTLMKWKTFNVFFFLKRQRKKTWIRILFLVMLPIIMTKPNQCDDYNRIEDKWYNTQLNIHIE